jgi:formylglycine-generating enzyme required for sulfatase activity
MLGVEMSVGSLMRRIMTMTIIVWSQVLFFSIGDCHGQERPKAPNLVSNSVGMKLVQVPVGEFLMGSPDADMAASDDEKPQHRVKITKPFYMGVFEVTQTEYETVTGENPSYFSKAGLSRNKVAGLDTSRFPVEHVRWPEAMEFCRRLSELPAEKSENRVYRLPTEAEWEYACRAGTTTTYHFGETLSSEQSNFNGTLNSPGATEGNFLGRPTTVGSYPPNALGLYDMHGNVWEWCSDWYLADYYKNSPQEDPQGAESSSDTSVRGGSWADAAADCRSAYRYNVLPVHRFPTRGFRVVMTVGEKKEIAATAEAKTEPLKPLSKEAAEREEFFLSQVRPFLSSYCLECHSGDQPQGGIPLHTFEHASELATTGRKDWEKIRGQLLAGSMPPPDSKQPPSAELDMLTNWIAGAVAAVDCSGESDPGHETIRRLNRTEYRNTIRDLLGIDYAEADNFPTDDTGAGGDSLTIAPVLMESYLKAAEEIAARAIVIDPAKADKNASHQRIIFTRPGHDLTRHEAASSILTKLASRAYRRPVTDVEIQRLLRLVDAIHEQGGSFEECIQFTLRAILVSPNFLFKVESDPPGEDPAAIRELNEYELATRISFFLWSSMPDDELLEHARQQTLREYLEIQIQRMLDDPRSQALGKDFGGQWLQLAKLRSIHPDREIFPEFDDELRVAMQTETQLFVAAIIRENRSIMELLTADFTFVNGRLARHYGMDQVVDGDFQRVSLIQNQRGGVLTQASILTLTSNATRTSPVKRGKWIMETILGTPPPAPPPGTPELTEPDATAASGSLRERMAQHVKNPRCAVCHMQMDSLGFSLENFDAIGRWRTSDGDVPIDASGELPDGLRIKGSEDLKSILSHVRKKDFIECLTEKLLAYALGRELEYFDQCAVDRITNTLSPDNDRFSTLVSQIILSEPFQKIRGKRKSSSW